MSDQRRIKPMRARRVPVSEGASSGGANPDAEASSSSTSQSQSQQPHPEGTNTGTTPSASEATANTLPSHIGVLFPQLSQHAPPYDSAAPSLFNFNRFSASSIESSTAPPAMDGIDWKARCNEERVGKERAEGQYQDQVSHVQRVEDDLKTAQGIVENIYLEVTEKEDEIKDLNSRLAQEREQIEKATEEVQRRVQQITDLTAEIKDLRAEADVRHKTITEKNAALRKFDAEINKAQSEVLAAIEARDKEEFKLNSLQIQYNELVEDHRVLQEELARFTAAAEELTEITNETFDQAAALVDKDEEIHELRKKVAYCQAHHEADVPDPDDLPEAVGPLEREQAQRSPKKSPKSDLGEELMDNIDETLDSSGDVEDSRSVDDTLGKSDIFTAFEESPVEHISRPSTKMSPRIMFEEQSVKAQSPYLAVLSPQTVAEILPVEYKPPPSAQDQPQTIIDEAPVEYEPPAFTHTQPLTVLDEPPVELQPPNFAMSQVQTSADEPPMERQPRASTYVEPRTFMDQPPIDEQPPVLELMPPHVVFEEPSVAHEATTSTTVPARTILNISPISAPAAPPVAPPPVSPSTPLALSQVKTLIDVGPLCATAHHSAQGMPWWAWIMLAVALVQTLLARRERSIWLGANDEARSLLGSFGGGSGESVVGAAVNAFVAAALGLSEGEIGEARAMMY